MRASPAALDAYEQLAPHYDAFTFEHDYEGWTTSLEGLLREHGLRGRRLLDVGCGTGRSFEPFLTRGWEVTACDLSPAMLAVAHRRAGPGTRLVEADMRDLPLLGEFDLVLCLDDAINYLDGPDDLESAFCCARRQLAPGGRYLFDVNTLATYRGAFSGRFGIAHDGVEFEWAGDPIDDVTPGCRVTARLSIRPSGGESALSVHTQRHHSEATVRAALERAGLDCLAVYGQRPDGRPRLPLDELDHSKAIYIACSPDED